MATWEEVKRAIYWSERYTEGLLEYVPWNGKTYAVFKNFKSGFPLTVVPEKPPEYSFDPVWLLIKLDARYKALAHPYLVLGFLGPNWHQTYKLKSGTTNGQRWRATIEYGFDTVTYSVQSGEEVSSVWNPVAEFNVEFEPEPPPSGVVTAKITPTAYYPTDYKSDAWFYNPKTRTSEPLIKDIKSNIGKIFTVKSEPFVGFPKLRYVIEETIDMAYYFWSNKPSYRSIIANHVVPLLDDLGIPSLTCRLPMALGIRDNLGTDCFNHYLCDWTSPSCDFWDYLPKTEGAFPHYKQMCIKVFFAVDARIWAIPFGICCADYDCYSALVMRPLHLLLTKKDPKYKEKVCFRHPFTGELWVVENSAEDYLVNGWKSIHVDADLQRNPPYIKGVTFAIVDRPPLIEEIKDASTWTEGPSKSFLLAALTVLGYGFNYPEVQDAVDKYVEFYIKNQWGYPFYPGEGGYGRFNGYGKVWRPDLAGAFHLYARDVEGSPTKAREGMVPPGWTAEHEDIIKIFGWGFPAEIYPPHMNMWFEYCAGYNALALRIYEYYKWRLR